MRDRRVRRIRGITAVLVLTASFASGATACSISAEEQPRPITRETTVAPPETITP